MRFMKLLHDAVRFAAKQHRGQERDGPVPLPYITHPLDVMNRLRYAGRVEDEAILAAAALHDLVEECDVTFDDLEERFGERVAGLVRELTRREPTDRETAGMSDEQIADLRSQWLLDEIARQSPDAQQVKLADRLSNLTAALATRTGEKRERYVRQSERILGIIPRDVNPHLWDELERLVASA